LGVFYISTFIDLADKLFRGEATTALMLRYFFFQTPQFVYFVIPIAVLVAVLVTLGILAKNSELAVMRACGISVYRTVTPLVVFSVLASATLFLMQEHVLATSNREADRLNRIIRGWPPASLGARQWVAGPNGDLYRFDYFDAETNKFSRLWAYHVDRDAWGLQGISYAEAVSAVERDGPDGPTVEWLGHQGWFRELTPSGHDRRMLVKYLPFEERPLLLDPPSYFKVDIPDAEMMTYDQLRDYIAQLQSGGGYAARFLVSLQRKVAFPFVTVFAVSTRSRGALYGIGIGIVVSILYWIALSLFGALGAGGVLEPMLAAWAPNILFGSVALYMIHTVRT
jgi:LPS export ABC transporter permease LptG